MANYTANVTKSRVDANTIEFSINILYGATKCCVLDQIAQGRVQTPTTPEILLTLNASVPKVGRSLTHNIDIYEHDSTHLYASVTVFFDLVPAWTVEIFAQPDPDPPHVYWVSATRIDANSPLSIESVVT